MSEAVWESRCEARDSQIDALKAENKRYREALEQIQRGWENPGQHAGEISRGAMMEIAWQALLPRPNG